LLHCNSRFLALQQQWRPCGACSKGGALIDSGVVSGNCSEAK
jgi:hypothetical protein